MNGLYHNLGYMLPEEASCQSRPADDMEIIEELKLDQCFHRAVLTGLT